MKKKLFALFLFSFFSIYSKAQSISTNKRALARAEAKFNRGDYDADHAIFRKYSKFLNANQAHLLAHCYFAEFCNRDINGTRKAMYFLKIAAQGGNACAQVNLADLYERGVDMKKDSKQAMRWYQKALHTNNPEIQFIVGTKYLEGIITEKNMLKCINLYQKASEKNHNNANIALGFIYTFGIGIVKNDSMANFYFSKIGKNKSNNYLEFNIENYLQQNIAKVNDLVFSIWFPNEYSTNEIIIAQLQPIMNLIKMHKGNFIINTSGNGSYDEQYLSWMKSTNLIKYFSDDIKIPQNNLIMSFGSSGKFQTSTVSFANENSEGPYLTPPPTSSLLNHRYDICGHSHFSP